MNCQRLSRVLGLLLASVFTSAVMAAPPYVVVRIDAAYPGASARTIADTIAAPVEQQVNGVEGAESLYSRSSADGNYRLLVAFRPGTDAHQALTLVQNRVNLAMPMLPDLVRKTGVSAAFETPPALVLCLDSPDGRFSPLELGNAAATQIVDELKRVAGVGQVSLAGQGVAGTSVRLDTQRLSALNLSVSEVVAAVSRQVSATGQVTKQGGDSDLAQIVISSPKDRAPIYLRDVAAVEKPIEYPAGRAWLDGRGACVLVVRPTANATPREVVSEVQKRIEAIGPRLPMGMKIGTFSVGDRGEAVTSNRGLLAVEARFPDVASQDRVADGLARLSKRLAAVPGVQSTLALSSDSTSAFHQGPCVLLKVARENGQQFQSLAQSINDLLSDGEFQDMATRLRSAGGQNGDLATHEIALFGPETDKLHEFSEKVLGRLHASKWSLAASLDLPANLAMLRIQVDRDAAARNGVSLSEANQVAAMCSGGAVVATSGRQLRLPVRIDVLGDDRRGGFDFVGSIPVRGSEGRYVPLRQIARIESSYNLSCVERWNMYPMLRLVATPRPGTDGAWANYLAVAAEVRRELGLADAYQLVRLLPQSNRADK